MWLQKDKGGCSILWRRVDYAWPEDNSVCEVPEQLGAELLAIRGGGYKVVPAPEPKPGPEAKGDGDQKPADDGHDNDGGKDDGSGDGDASQDDASAKAGTGAAKPPRAKTAKPAA
jgi:hypothetical protein